MNPAIHEIVLNNMSDQVYVRDFDKNLLFINRAAERLTGWSCRESKTRKCYEVFGDRQGSCKDCCPVDQAIEQNEPIFHHEGELETRSGDVRQMKVSITPFQTTQIESGAVVVMQDVTKLHHLEKTHVKTLIQLEKEVQIKREKQIQLVQKERFQHAIFNAIQDGISVIDNASTIIFTNRKMNEMYSHAAPLEGKKCFQAYQNRDKPCRSCPARKCMETRKLETEYVPFQGKGNSGRILELFAYPILDVAGNVERIVEYTRDITDQVRAETFLKLQRDLAVKLSNTDNFDVALEEFLEAILSLDDVDGAGIYQMDKETGGIRLIRHKNLQPWFVRMSTYYEETSRQVQLIRKNVPIYSSYASLLHSLGLDKEEIDRRTGSGIRTIAVIPIHHGGKTIAAMNVVSSHTDQFQKFTKYALEAIAVQIGEISQKIISREILKESQQNLQALFENIEDFLFVLDENGRVVAVNPKAREKLGYSYDELYKMNVLDLHPPSRREEAGRIVTSMLSGQAKYCPVPLLAKSGKQIPVETQVAFGKWNNEKAIFGLSRDISERVKQEKERQILEDRLSTSIDAMDEGFALFDSEDRLIMFNEKYANIFEKSREKIFRGAKFESIVRAGVENGQYPDAIGREKEWLAEQVNRHRSTRSNFEQKLTKGRWIKVAERKTPGGSTVSFQVDITDMKKSEEALIKALGEKQILLKEIHHRVKNNLQVISSLLNLQAKALTGQDKAVLAFEETENRIHAMALVHEMLYQCGTFSQINFKEYMERLAGYLSGTCAGTIRIAVDAQEIMLKMEQAMTCGFIATELISNSLKHAFEPGGTGRVDIKIWTAGKNRYQMSITDNGRGFPKKIKWKTAGTLGLRLVRELVRGQLEGDLSMFEDGGVRWVVIWTENP